MFRMNEMNRIQRQWTWTVTGQYLRALAGMRFPAWVPRNAMSCSTLSRSLLPPTPRCSGPMDAFTNMLDYRRRALQASPARHAPEFLQRQQLRGGVRTFPVQLSPGRLHTGK